MHSPTRLGLLFLGALLTIVSCEHDQAEFPSGKIIDLTYAFGEDTVYWPTAEGFKLETVFKGENEKGFHYEANNYSAAEHGGTHLDAPVHFFANRHTTDEIPLERLLGPAVLVDISPKCDANPDYQIQTQDLIEWEKRNGMLLNNVILLMRTGFGKFWPDRKKYMGTEKVGDQAISKLHFPGLHPNAAEWLVTNRSVKAIGIDTPSIDFGQSTGFESHITLYEKNLPAFENVANLDMLPEKNFLVIALPMKIRGGSGAPLRIVAIVN